MTDSMYSSFVMLDFITFENLYCVVVEQAYNTAIGPSRERTRAATTLGSLNRVPALIGWGKGGNVTSAGCQVTLCDPIWHVSSSSGAVLVAQTAIRFLTLSKKPTNGTLSSDAITPQLDTPPT